MNDPSASQQAILKTFLTHYGVMMVAARRYVPLPDLAGDVVQQCYIEFSKMVESGQWRLDDDNGARLRQLAKHRAINVWRTRREHLPEYQQSIADRLLQRVQERNEEIESTSREIKAMEFCVQNLSDASRELIERHYFEGDSIESLAKEKELNPGSLRQTFSRLRMKLKNCIEKTLTIDIDV